MSRSSKRRTLETVEAHIVDILARTKARSAFAGSSHNNLIFTKQGMSPFVRKTMSNLGGDTVLNKWSVPLIPFSKLVTLKREPYEKVFGYR